MKNADFCLLNEIYLGNHGLLCVYGQLPIDCCFYEHAILQRQDLAKQGDKIGVGESAPERRYVALPTGHRARDP